MPKVSIIMNCYNSEKYLREAIDSVYAQTFEDWEIIFWDNASTDGSAEIARSYDERLRYFRGGETVPLYAARNLAIEQASGDFIAFLDCDDLWLPEKLEKQMPFFKNEEVGLVYSDAMLFGEEGDMRRMYTKSAPLTGWCFGELLSNYNLAMCTVVLRRDVLNSHSLRFDDSCTMVGDAELFLKMAYYGAIEVAPEVLAKRRVHDENLSSTQPEMFFTEGEEMLKRLAGVIPEFYARYGDQIALYRNNIYFGVAVLNWKMGEAAKGRRLLRDHISFGFRPAVLFVLSFFPYPWLQRVLKALGVTF